MTETLNTFEEGSGDAQQAHDQAMLEKAEQLEAANSGERPEWLPSKFESPEAMAQAYASLERKLGSSPSEDTQTETTDTLPTEAEPETDDVEEMEQQAEQQTSEVSQALDEAGLDFNTFQEEYAENGELSDDAYEALEEAGFSRSLVDSWIAGQEALANSVQNSVYSIAGGEEGYMEMVNWAAENLSSQEITAFNANVDSGDPALTQFAVQGLYARYRSEGTSEPTLIQGQASTNQGGAFNSAAELTAAMRDPRYHKDPAYRQSVAEKLARSNVF
jgi:hypothetical protein